MVAFTAPSGAGKTTIVHHLLKKYSEYFSFSISATTRGKRDNEVDGVDYFFMSNDEFQTNIEENSFIEWEEVYDDRFYGTLRSEVDRVVLEGKKVVFDIEINGAQNLKKTYDERCLVIYVKPPDFQTLVKRLINRKSESPQTLEDRIKRIKKELLFEHSFDMVLLNDNLEETLAKAEEIIETYVLPKD
ncbi:MAG: guanylate kinase [Saprospiraceae bacterium]|nr:guanylate kinase [Saprospiraceae bacterium]